MSNCTALVPLVDEAAEFRHFERQTDARRAAEERQRREVDARLSEADARLSEAERRRRKELRRVFRRVRACVMGMLATVCAISAVLLWSPEAPLSAVFPALCSALAVWNGIRR